jgi:hypothetical protein
MSEANIHQKDKKIKTDVKYIVHNKLKSIFNKDQ